MVNVNGHSLMGIAASIVIKNREWVGVMKPASIEKDVYCLRVTKPVSSFVNRLRLLMTNTVTPQRNGLRNRNRLSLPVFRNGHRNHSRNPFFEMVMNQHSWIQYEHC
jgi:hypothetical protein